jgi:hypothetical protein
MRRLFGDVWHLDGEYRLYIHSAKIVSSRSPRLPELVADKARPPREDVRSPVSLEHSVNVFGMSQESRQGELTDQTDSIEENAFNRIPDIVSGADLIEDDLPTNLDYLDTATRPRQGVATDRSAGETLHSWQATHDDGSAEAGETIKILLDHFDVDEGYWDALPALTTDLADEYVHCASVELVY